MKATWISTYRQSFLVRGGASHASGMGPVTRLMTNKRHYCATICFSAHPTTGCDACTSWLSSYRIAMKPLAKLDLHGSGGRMQCRCSLALALLESVSQLSALRNSQYISILECQQGDPGHALHHLLRLRQASSGSAPASSRPNETNYTRCIHADRECKILDTVNKHKPSALEYALVSSREKAGWLEGTYELPGDDVIHVLPKKLDSSAEVRPLGQIGFSCVRMHTITLHAYSFACNSRCNRGGGTERATATHTRSRYMHVYPYESYVQGVTGKSCYASAGHCVCCVSSTQAGYSQRPQSLFAAGDSDLLPA